MNIYIEYINTIRANLGYDRILYMEAPNELHNPSMHFQELVAELSDELYNLKKRVKETLNMSNKIFEVMSDTDTVLITASESKAYQKALEVYEPWIVEMVLNSDPHKEFIWDKLCNFRKEYMV